jgi:hypothetical protein
MIRSPLRSPQAQRNTPSDSRKSQNQICKKIAFQTPKLGKYDLYEEPHVKSANGDPDYYGPPVYYGPGYYYGPGPYAYEPPPVYVRPMPRYSPGGGCWIVTDKDRGYGYYGPCR